MKEEFDENGKFTGDVNLTEAVGIAPKGAGNGSLTEGRVAPSNPWDVAMARQKELDEQAAIKKNQQMFDQYGDIETTERQKRLELDHQRAIAGAAMLQSAFRNGGMSDRSLSGAFSQALGQNVFGGQLVNFGKGRTGFLIFGAGKDAKGNAAVTPVGMMDETQMMKVLQSAKLGDRTLDLQKLLYSKLASRFTADQLDKIGVRNPTAPISTGSTTISGADMRALRGEPRTPSRVETFAADGKGGFSKSAYDRKTGEDWQTDYGERSPDRQGRWKVVSSGLNGDFDGEVYVNDKTGEKVYVPKGENLNDVLSGESAKKKRLQMELDARRDVAKTNAQAEAEEREATAEERRSARQEEMRSRFIGDMAKSLSKDLQGADIPEEKVGEIINKRLAELLEQYDEHMGYSNPGGKKEVPKDDNTIIGGVAGAAGGGKTAPSAQEVADAQTDLEVLEAEKKRREEEKKKKREQEEAEDTRWSAFTSAYD